jgi:hypothetical protein
VAVVGLAACQSPDDQGPAAHHSPCVESMRVGQTCSSEAHRTCADGTPAPVAPGMCPEELEAPSGSRFECENDYLDCAHWCDYFFGGGVLNPAQFGCYVQCDNEFNHCVAHILH